MRAARLSIVFAMALLAAAGAGAHAAGPPRIGPIGGTPTIAMPPDQEGSPLTAELSTRRAGAKRVTLTLRLRTALVCGEPGPAAVVVQLPTAAQIPTTLPRSAVAIGGQVPATVRVKDHRVTISPLRTPGTVCHSIRIGTLVIRFTRLAQLQNPRSPGSYAVVVRRGAAGYSAKIRISA